MIRGSHFALALASVFALNGCSQCSNPGADTAPVDQAPVATPAEQPATDGAAPAEGAAAPADGMTAPAEGGEGQ